MLATSSIDDLHYYPDCAPEQLEAVLAILDRWSKRAEGHAALGRRHARHPLRTEARLELAERSPFPGVVNPPRITFHVTARNVSVSGLGFVAPPKFIAREPTDATPALRTEMLFKLGAKLHISLSDKLHMYGAVVRLRNVHHGFFEAGIVFAGKT